MVVLMLHGRRPRLRIISISVRISHLRRYRFIELNPGMCFMKSASPQPRRRYPRLDNV